MMDLDNLIAPSLMDQLHDNIQIMDCSSNFVTANKSQLATMGFRYKKDIVDKSYEVFTGISSQAQELFLQQDQFSLKNNHIFKFLSFHTYGDKKSHLLLGEKTPIFDEQNSQIGIFGQSKDIYNLHLLDISRFLSDANKMYATKRLSKEFSVQIVDHDVKKY